MNFASGPARKRLNILFEVGNQNVIAKGLQTTIGISFQRLTDILVFFQHHHHSVLHLDSASVLSQLDFVPHADYLRSSVHCVYKRKHQQYANGITMNAPVQFLLAFFIAYVAGSVNFSILAFRLSGREDPRRHGSRNPGATNVYRQAGLTWALVVLLLDMGRAVFIGKMAILWLSFWQVPWVGLGLILGNRFPCFHGLKGGKGVANYLGYTLAIAPEWAGLSMLAWGAAHLIWRTPFLSSFAMVFALSIGTAFGTDLTWQGSLGAMATAVFIVGCHHTNIRERWGKKPESASSL
jgi:glycerol-3-phosphate acyltransferase PlsY